MLERLEITDFAVARQAALEPAPGLTAFTGETGAGKSLVAGALAFVFGARTGREVVAAGAQRATVRAHLRLAEGPATIERSIGLAGRSAVRIDDAPATVDDLQALGARFADIHGQSGQLALLRPATQLAALDEFAGLAGKQRDFAALVRELREVRRALRSLVTDARGRERQAAQLAFEVDEIAAAALQPGEDEALRAEQLRLANAGRLREDAAAAIAALDEPAIGEALAALASILARDTAAAEEFSGLALSFETSATDLARALRRYLDSVEEDPGRLATVEARLDQVARLRRKYGDTVADVLEYLADVRARLAALQAAESSAEGLAGRERELLREASARAIDLSRLRRAAAAGLVRAIAGELEGLGMPGASLAAGFSCEDDPEGLAVACPDYDVVGPGAPAADGAETLPRAFTETGVDRLELLASFNPGEAPRPLATVASGGETSRFLLALTAVLGQAAEPRLIVFDEVDEGVGGRAGALVGAALARLATRHQVLCITHLPQVAAFATKHLVVTKQSDGARTWSKVREVTGDERVDELAAMLGGVTEARRTAARELLASHA